MLDMVEALRPGELFALRWQSFDNLNTLSITETVYRWRTMPFGKTPGSRTNVHLPDGFAGELRQWRPSAKSIVQETCLPQSRAREGSSRSVYFPKRRRWFP